MKMLPIFLFAGLLMATPASPLRALPASTILLAEETLSDATVQHVLDLAAPLVGQSSASLYADYLRGTVTITDLGPIRGGHRYGVHGSQFGNIVIDDLMAS